MNEDYRSDRERREKEKKQEELEIFKAVYNKNPNKETHDFYLFVAKPEFIEEDDGRFRKILGIENMVRITPDQESLGNMKGMQMRAQFTQQTLYHIWLPKEIREEVEGKGFESIEPWLLELITKHAEKGSDEYGRDIYKDVSSKIKAKNKEIRDFKDEAEKDLRKFNL